MRRQPTYIESQNGGAFAATRHSRRNRVERNPEEPRFRFSHDDEPLPILSEQDARADYDSLNDSCVRAINVEPGTRAPYPSWSGKDLHAPRGGDRLRRFDDLDEDGRPREPKFYDSQSPESRMARGSQWPNNSPSNGFDRLGGRYKSSDYDLNDGRFSAGGQGAYGSGQGAYGIGQGAYDSQLPTPFQSPYYKNNNSGYDFGPSHLDVIPRQGDVATYNVANHQLERAQMRRINQQPRTVDYSRLGEDGYEIDDYDGDFDDDYGRDRTQGRQRASREQDRYRGGREQGRERGGREQGRQRSSRELMSRSEYRQEARNNMNQDSFFVRHRAKIIAVVAIVVIVVAVKLIFF